MSGLLAAIFRTHWTVKSHSILKFSLSTTPSGFCSYQLLALSNPHLPQSCQWIYRYHAFLYIMSAPAYRTHSPHGPPFLPYFCTLCTKGILLCDQYEISYNGPFAACHSRGTKPPCWDEKVALGQDQQKAYIILNVIFLCLSCPSATFVPREWQAAEGQFFLKACPWVLHIRASVHPSITRNT